MDKIQERFVAACSEFVRSDLPGKRIDSVQPSAPDVCCRSPAADSKRVASCIILSETQAHPIRAATQIDLVPKPLSNCCISSAVPSLCVRVIGDHCLNLTKTCCPEIPHGCAPLLKPGFSVQYCIASLISDPGGSRDLPKQNTATSRPMGPYGTLLWTTVHA